jgi:hypothetical protein
MRENLEVIWAEFTTLSLAVFLITPKMPSMQMATSKVENSAQVLSCLLKFVHDMFKPIFGDQAVAFAQINLVKSTCFPNWQIFFGKNDIL